MLRRFLPPSPPAEQATARKDQAGKAGTDDGAWYWNGIGRRDDDSARVITNGCDILRDAAGDVDHQRNVIGRSWRNGRERRENGASCCSILRSDRRTAASDIIIAEQRATGGADKHSGVMIQCRRRKNGKPGAVCPSSSTRMRGKSGNLTRLSSASSYSSTCQSPIPFSPTSRMKASAWAISSASVLDQKPPARRLDGATS
jgi:hypothetical protein